MHRLAPLLLAVAATGAVAQEPPAVSLDRMSWDASCAEIRGHLATALERNAEIARDARRGIRDRLDAAAEVEGDRAACLAPLKDAYDRLVAAYGRTGSSVNILGGATDAPDEPAAVEPETLEGPRTGDRIGGDPDASD